MVRVIVPVRYKVFLPTVGGVAPRVTVVRLVQAEKVEDPIFFASGRLTVVRLVQPSKVLLPLKIP
jgi:hypothetical protein